MTKRVDFDKIKNDYIDQVTSINSNDKLQDKEEALEKARRDTVNDFETAAIETVQDYIVSKYNACSLLSQSKTTSRRDYSPRLNALNSIFLSNLYSDDSVDITVYDKLATLNFRTHNYITALEFIRKALNCEPDGTGDIFPSEIVEELFMRRWHAALCMEYIGLDELHGIRLQVSDGINYLKKTIELLVGKKILESNDNDLRDYIENLRKLENPTPEMCISVFLDESSTIDIDEVSIVNAPCLAKQVLNWINNRDIEQQSQNEDEQRVQKEFSGLRIRFFENITHTLAHCLSEFVKYSSEGKPHDTKENYYIRIADILMKMLGDKYVTCQATLLLESGNYYAALNHLESAKRSLLEKLDICALEQRGGFPKELYLNYKKLSTEEVKVLNDMALIEFYYWYYSVFSNNINAEINKQVFKSYCDTSKDPVAITYYNVINLKGLLIKGFKDVLSGSELVNLLSTLGEVSLAHEELEKSKPWPYIHTDIWKEWELLDVAYKAFRIYTESKDDAAMLCHRLYKLLIIDNNNHDPIEAKEVDDFGKDAKFYFVTTELGTFIFRGKREYLSELLSNYECNAVVHAYNINIEAFLQLGESCDVSNVYLAFGQDTLHDDLNFLFSVIKSDKNRAKEAMHSVYIDTSLVKTEVVNNSLKGFRYPGYAFSSIEQLEKTIDRLFVFHESIIASQFCMTFSCLEKLLSKLYLPLESNLISPITEDETYTNQLGSMNQPACDFISNNDVSQIKTIHPFNPVDKVVLSCITSQSGTTYDGIRLDFKNLEKCCSKVDAIYCFAVIYFYNESKSQVQERAAKLNVFDIHSNLSYTLSSLYSDTARISNAENLEEALQGLMVNDENRSRNHTYPKKCDKHTCYTFVLSQTANNTHYQFLRDYLYTLKGIIIPENASVLLHRTKTSRNGSDYEYSLIICDRSIEFAFDDIDIKKTCEALCSRELYQEIEEENAQDIISMEPTLSELISRIHRPKEGQKYVFVSFRSNKNKDALCRPVFNDIYNLQCLLDECTGGDVTVYFDIVQIGDSISKELEAAIENSNCIGSIVYATAEYIVPDDNTEGKIKPDDDDYCLKELSMIMKKKQENEAAFFVFPVFFKTPLYNHKGYANLDDFVIRSIRYLQDEKRKTRVELTIGLFDCDSNLIIRRPYYQLRYDGNHYLASEHLNNALHSAGITVKRWNEIKRSRGF